MEISSIQEYISLLEKLEKLYTYKSTNNVSAGWIPNFTYKPHFIYRGHGVEDMGTIDIRFFREFFGQRMDRKE